MLDTPVPVFVFPAPVPEVAGTGALSNGPSFCLSGTGPGQPGPVPAKPGPVTSHRLPCVRVHVRIADLPGARGIAYLVIAIESILRGRGRGVWAII